MKDISNKCLMCHWYCDEVLEECQGEEEPCHEFVLAREYKIMEKNLMSDDLISRKAVINYLREQNNNLLMEKRKNGVVSTEACRGMESALIAFRSFILNLPTAFYKEKTIEELKSAIGDIHYTEDGSFDGKCIEDFEFIQAKTALEIVEKGGVE